MNVSQITTMEAPFGLMATAAPTAPTHPSIWCLKLIKLYVLFELNLNTVSNYNADLPFKLVYSNGI